ncbi:hypothetical protein CTEN210_00298 [Chaetoceros tenuissimus]|uniref:Uncharacterized protein n=1 Tax=Chaetoceros tenuissimus TaxID=426638 RepID=A0AAD3CEW3_9STRA|nr:hypothetical protein CTEN210_00298 [Chaetoceros tenuissimus]
MRVATVDGLVTLFYDGSKELWNRQLDIEWWDAQHRRNHDEDDDVETLDVSALDVSDECREYWRERFSWQQIIIVEGVTDIPYMTFSGCKNIKRVIFSNTVIRIEQCAFISCKNLVYIKWSMNLEYIGPYAFEECNLSSAFIPPRCREICESAFQCNENLSIFHVPQDTELGQGIIKCTSFAKASPPMAGDYNFMQTIRMNRWIKTMNNEEEFVLH